MISTIAELIDDLRRREVELLDKQDITHPPTIGRMYEGLTRSILKTTLPVGANLATVSGFITNDEGILSKEIDCMLVLGEGNRIPHTDSFIYHIRNVVAVVEVKKNLYSNDLKSAYDNLLAVKRLQQTKVPENRLFNDAYRSILQSDPHQYEDINILPDWKRQIGFALHIESIVPLRIILGYHGFSSELSLRESFMEYLERKVPNEGYGTASLPSLIICDKYSLVKLNGMPYSIPVVNNPGQLYAAFGMQNLFEGAPVNSDLWPVYASYAFNPMVLLLELIWTRLTYSQQMSSSVFDSDLSIEVLKPLLLAKVIEQGGELGWHYGYFWLPQEILEQTPPTIDWRPVELSDGQAAIILYLIEEENSGLTDGVNIDSPDLIKIMQKFDESIRESIEFLRHSDLISLEDGKLRLLTRECQILVLPGGQFIAGENRDGRLSKWLTNYMDDKAAPA